MALLLLLLAALFDDRPPSGIEHRNTPPNVIAVALRMPLLKKDMTIEETEAILGLGGCCAGSMGTLRTSVDLYCLRPDYELTLVFRNDLGQDKSFLCNAKLRKRKLSLLPN